MTFQGSLTKKAALRRLGKAVGFEFTLGEGSSIPRAMFDAVADEAGVSTAGSMPIVAEKIARAAGLTWGPECDSRDTPSGGGSTVTLTGMNRLIEAMERLSGRSSAVPVGGSMELGTAYLPHRGGIDAPPAALLRNWDALDEATRAHQQLEASLAEYVRESGWHPRSPATGEPLYDLAWHCSSATVVAEVKSATTANHRQQVRLGVGQVLEYTAILEGLMNERVNPVLLIGEKPTGDDILLARRTGIVIVGPGDLHARLRCTSPSGVNRLDIVSK